MPNESNRRTFLTGAGAAGAAAIAGLAVSCSTDDEPDATATDTGPGASTSTAQPGGATTRRVPFAAEHQQGVLEPPAAAGAVAAFDVVDGGRDELADILRGLSDEVARIMEGRPPATSEDFLPPSDSGAVDIDAKRGPTAITVAVGASLFDERFGLADRRPSQLIAMPRFRNDRLVRAELSHGDLALTIAAPNQQAVAHALHQVVRVTDRRLRLRWVQAGHNELLAPSPDRVAPTRNLMGFRDGTSNLDTADAEVMAEHVWIGPGDEPQWATGGTYQAVRVIRMFIEFWATAALVRQEQIFGRHRDTGAPLGQQREGDEPAFASDPSDDSVPRRSHIRLANPRTADTGRILRRGFSYVNGADPADGTLDQGLLFLAYQRSLQRGFLAAQARLDGEPLEDYVKPVGGGLFFVLPGPGDGWLGESLLAAD